MSKNGGGRLDDRPEVYEDSAATLRQVAEVLTELGESHEEGRDPDTLDRVIERVEALMQHVRRASARPVTPDASILLDVQAGLAGVMQDLESLRLAD